MCLEPRYLFIMFCLYGNGDHRDLHVLTHSFPTRRSSDLAVMARPDPRREEIAAVDRRAMGAIAVEEGRPSRAARIDEILPERKRPARISQQRRDRKSTRLNSSH